MLDELKEQEDVLNESVGQLEALAATRSALVLQLKEALQDQVQILHYFTYVLTSVFCLKFQILIVAWEYNFTGTKAGSCSHSVASKSC